MPTPARLLLDPNRFDPRHLDAESRRHLQALIDWFEERGNNPTDDEKTGT